MMHDDFKLKLKIEALLLRGTTRSVIAYGSGLERSEISTVLGGGNLTYGKERLLNRFLDGLASALDMADQDFPGLKLDLKDTEFVKKLVDAAYRILNERLEEHSRIAVQTAKFARIASRGLEAATCSVSEREKI
jgi:hypothetical protein